MAFGPVAYKFQADNADGNWHVRRFTLDESLSDVYHCEVELVHAEAGADIEALLGQSATVTLTRANGAERKVCGIVQRAVLAGGFRTHVAVELEIVPALWALTKSTNSRIFKEKAAPDILKTVLGDGLKPYQRNVKLDLKRSDYAEREYCVQYHETDYDFAQRLMEEEGIFFYFDHSGSAEQMVLVDSNDSLPQCPGPAGPSVKLKAPGSGAPDSEVVHSLRPVRQLGSTSIILHEYDWKQPALPIHQEVHGQDGVQHERIVYDSVPALCISDSGNDGKARKQLRKEELESEAFVCGGESIVTGFAPGLIFELQGHSMPDLDRKYAIIGTSHEGTVPDEWAGGAKTEFEYHNRFRCISKDVPYRPPLKHQRPSLGIQTAVVSGPSGEEVHTDEHGRVKVQFHWDRDGQNNEKSSCWVRVAQAWAGAGFGMLLLPRIGMEVVVQFLDGSPDRPLITGCLYNGRNLAPIKLPDDKTKSGLITRSSRKGSDGNHLIFEDAIDNEEISLVAQKDWTVVVKNDLDETVRGNSTRTVEKNDDNTIDGDHSESIGGKDEVEVKGNRTVTVSGNYTEEVSKSLKTSVSENATETVSKNYKLEVGKDAAVKVDGKSTTNVDGESETEVGKNMRLKVGKEAQVDVSKNLTVKVGSEVVIKADKSLTLKCGSASVTLKSGGKIEIKGGEISVEGSGNVKIKGSQISQN